MSLATKALILRCYLSTTTLKKTDVRASEEVAAVKGAEKANARVVKQLINRKYIKPLTSTIGAIRTYINEESLPWGKDERLIPSTKYFDVITMLSYFQDELENRLNIFVQNYYNAVNEARYELGDLWNENDYESAESIRNKFHFSVKFTAVPDANQFSKMGLDDDDAEALEKQVLERENELMKDAIGDCYKRIYKHVSVLAKRLKDPETKRFRSALIDNVTTLVETLPPLNIHNDSELTEVLDDIRQLVAGVSIEDIKDDEDVRKQVAKEADDIVAKLESFF